MALTEGKAEVVGVLLEENGVGSILLDVNGEQVRLAMSRHEWERLWLFWGAARAKAKEILVEQDDMGTVYAWDGLVGENPREKANGEAT